MVRCQVSWSAGKEATARVTVQAETAGATRTIRKAGQGRTAIGAESALPAKNRSRLLDLVPASPSASELARLLLITLGMHSSIGTEYAVSEREAR